MNSIFSYTVKKAFSFGLAGAVIISGINTIAPLKTADAADTLTIKLEPESRSVFNDTDGDGFGEFEGFGTSLCWWANRCGYDTTLTNEAAKFLYNKEDGLGLTIGRYNIGGGDDPDHNHITRSDSKLPGFFSSEQKLSDTSQASSYDAYDEASGYAWNYDWTADSNQLNVALACQKEAGDEFQAETFSNSAPYFMTVSGCTSGSEKAGTTNLKSDCYDAFSTYLADVTKHLIQEDGLNVTSISPMNEPESSDWVANSPKQEGCHIDAGSNQSALLTSLSSKLSSLQLDNLTLAGVDSSGVSTSAASFRALSTAAKAALERIDTHAYIDSGTAVLRNLAVKNNKNLWMSEVDGNVIAGNNAGEMNAALGFAQYLNKQLNGLQPSAWIMWDAIDAHIDSSNDADLNSLTEEERIQKDTNGFWGILFADHDNKQIIKTKKYYAYGQYSRYIRPGYTLIGSSNNSVAAYDKKTDTLIIVATNTAKADQKCKFDLSKFTAIAADSTVTSIRTSGTLNSGENWKDVSDTIGNTLNKSAKKLATTLKGNSITTYIITGVSLTETNSLSDLKQLSVSQNQISGLSLSDSNTLGNLADNNYDTEYIYKNGMAIIDLGSVCKINAITYVGSDMNPNNSRQISFYGSNNQKSWTKLYTITSVPSSRTPSVILSSEFASGKKKYRYIKCKKSTGKLALSELKIYGSSTASSIVTKCPAALNNNFKSLPKKITLADKQSAKVSTWSFYRGINDNMTAKQRKTILLTAHLNKSLTDYGNTVNYTVTMKPALYKKLKDKRFTITTKKGVTILTDVTSTKKKIKYTIKNGNLIQIS